MVLLKKLWKDSASLIICGRNPNNALINGCNYKILMMKRSSKASFMPNLVVFPGGVLEPADCQSEWTSFYSTKGLSSNKFESLRTNQKSRPFLFDQKHWVHRSGQSEQATAEEAIDRDISLRLCGIREIFEEVGILIGQKSTSGVELGDSKTNFAHLSPLDNTKHWQTAVHDDPLQFRQLCEQFQVIPDVWSLYEWANWLTPTLFGNKRFDTAFYLAALDTQPEVLAEENEVQEYLWASPSELVAMYRAKEIQLPPPQLYELSRLTNLDSIDSVARFAKQRSRFGTTPFYPVMYALKDGQVSIYPGDTLYPREPDYVGDTHDTKRFAAMTCDEFRSRSRNIHRMEHHPDGMRIFFNVESSNCHLNPIVAGGSRL